jgi:hypothetical protein
MLGRRLTALALALVCAGGASSANASQRIAQNATDVRLAVNANGTALVTYRANGRITHTLVWGAVNALPPSRTVPQVRFRMDFSGGWRSRHRLVWKRFKNGCSKYDGPALDFLVTTCKAPDGSYWALQAWQPYLPHRGYPAWDAKQTVWELHVSHWSGPLAQLEAYPDWAFGGQAHGLFGRLMYLGNPVYGFGSGRNGAPSDKYGRHLYIDTFDSAYGPGWKRETSTAFRTGSGAFCYSFWPTHDHTLPGYPNNPRPPGKGKRYRITVVGPGVTPLIRWEAAGLHDFNPNNSADVDYERRMDSIFMRWLAKDKFCPSQR